MERSYEQGAGAQHTTQLFVSATKASGHSGHHPARLIIHLTQQILANGKHKGL
jgi:hypothetical protein